MLDPKKIEGVEVVAVCSRRRPLPNDSQKISARPGLTTTGGR